MFFKKKKLNFDAQKSNTIKNAVNITCPVCQHEQPEPKMALSTNCKKCRTYFKIENGEAIPPSGQYTPVKTHPSSEKETTSGKNKDPEELTKISNPIKTAPTKDKPLPEKTTETQPENTSPQSVEQKTTEQPVNIEPKPKTESSLPTDHPTPVESATEEPIEQDPPPEDTAATEDLTPKRFTPVVQEAKKLPPPTGLFGKSKAPQTREVSCLECDHLHQAPAGASSTNCPQCGTYITLKDFDIRGSSNQRIKTRGDVTIHKKASVTGITIRCHHLLVYGQFTGGVNCSGDFTLNSNSKIMGTVNCKRLIIEKKANVEFANHVYAEEIIIDGAAIGHFTCTGKLQLKKKATLTGDIKVATMTMEEGAQHNGQMSIGQ